MKYVQIKQKIRFQLIMIGNSGEALKCFSIKMIWCLSINGLDRHESILPV